MEESGGLMLMGEFNHTIDNKNRLIIPSKLRSELEGATITRGLDKCLAIYPKNEWDKIVTKLATLHGLRMTYILDENIKKLEERYPDGFSENASINRKEYK